MTKALPILAGILVSATLLAAPAQAFGLVTRAEACDDAKVLKFITKRFRYQVRHVPNLPDVEIVALDRIHQHRFVPAVAKIKTSERFCMATATLSDGRRRSVWFRIVSDMGFASIGDGVEFCVSGFDRWNVYNGSCRILR